MPKTDEEKRQIDGAQIRLIIGFQEIGSELATQLSSQPDLVEELDTVFHQAVGEPGDSYKVTINYYFFESGRTFTELINSPFITAFLKSSLCYPEEKELLTKLRSVTLPDSSDIKEFNEFLANRIKTVARGFQNLVLSNTLIKPLSPVENVIARRSNMTRWWNEHPELANEVRMLAAKKGSEFGPKRYTPELRGIIQSCFNKGLTYEETVVWLAENLGVRTTESGLRHAVNLYDDLEYIPALRVKALKDRVRTRVIGVYHQTGGSRQEMLSILTQEGILPGTIAAIIRQEGLRNRVDWEQTVQLADQLLSLNEALILNAKSHPWQSLQEEYEHFIHVLNQYGYDDIATTITLSRFSRKKYYLLPPKHV